MTVKYRRNFPERYSSVRKPHPHEHVQWDSFHGLAKRDKNAAIIGYFLDKRDRAASMYESNRAKNHGFGDERLLGTLRYYAHIVSLIKVGFMKNGWAQSMYELERNLRPVASHHVSEDEVDDVFKTMTDCDEWKAAYQMFKIPVIQRP